MSSEKLRNIRKQAEANMEKARAVIAAGRFEENWRSIGAKINLVGSLRTGLLMKHLDVDFHIYSAHPVLSDGLAVILKTAENLPVRNFYYADQMATEEKCLEYHLQCEFEGELWSVDLIHIESGSRYDSYFELVADRISALLTPETRDAILELKYDTPPTEKAMGIEYYMAVLRDGIRNYGEFAEWRKNRSLAEFMAWMPPEPLSVPPIR